jgi:TRAP-type C4-dicarboxylate transport system permease small subunit
LGLRFECERNDSLTSNPRATRFVGCIFAFAVFGWRYLNVPQNWGYVGSKWSLWFMGLTLLPELVFPFVYLRVHKEQEARQELERKRR